MMAISNREYVVGHLMIGFSMSNPGCTPLPLPTSWPRFGGIVCSISFLLFFVGYFLHILSVFCVYSEGFLDDFSCENWKKLQVG